MFFRMKRLVIVDRLSFLQLAFFTTRTVGAFEELNWVRSIDKLSIK